MSDAPSKPTALIVENDDQLMSVLTFMLSRECYEVVECRDGRAAETYIREHPPVDVILLELVLPYTDGFELIRQVRSTPDWGDVPIVVLSTRRLEGDVVRGLEAGANDYVTKPFSPRELLARIRRHSRPPGAAEQAA
jgi:two-component system phosphate regulon response regulator PhoB